MADDVSHNLALQGAPEAGCLDGETLVELAARADKALAAGGEAVVTRSRTASVARLVCMHRGAELDVHVKRFNCCNWRREALRRLRPSRARRAERAAGELERLGAPTPRVLGVLERRRGLGRESYLVTLTVPGAVNLRQLILGEMTRGEMPRGEAPGGVQAAGTRGLSPALIREVGGLVGTLHAAGAYHGDLKCRNFLVAPGEGDTPRPYLTDLDRMAWGRGFSRRRAVVDLARLKVSLASVAPESWGDVWSTYLAACPKAAASAARLEGLIEGRRARKYGPEVVWD